MLGWRESWVKMCNAALYGNGIDARIDHRSYEGQGIDKVPGIHLGPYAYYAEKEGKRTELGDLNRQIQSDNAFLKRFEKQIEELERTSPLQVKKRNEIKQSIVETEEQLQALKKNLDEIRERRRKLKEAPASDPEAIEQKKKQIQNLKEIQSQTHSHNSPSGFFQLLSLYIKNRW